MSEKTADCKKDTAHTDRNSNSLLTKSAQGATFLILLQIASRALTFIVNQVLLRYLSPKLLGIASQLELLSISTLYFARESVRVALQRQPGDNEQEQTSNENGKKGKAQPASSYGTSRKIQEVVNLSYAAVALGLLWTFAFQWLYLHKADVAVLSTPHIYTSIYTYGAATIIELLNEPRFAIAQVQMMYSTRASAEMQATLTRCLVTCGTAIWASRSGLDLGVLPFAMGQLSYASVLNLSYLPSTYFICAQNAASLLPRMLNGNTLPRPLVNLAITLWIQSIFKQLLTSGDAYLIATLASLPSQGAYALASNYGSLAARILFQPIEESSRSFFAKLLPTHLQKTSSTSLNQATKYLTNLLHAYILLSLLVIALIPPLAPLIVHTIAGPRWSDTEAPTVLAAYAYYIPLLALNGILEAFVSAVATPTQLRTQSMWMIAFSLAFAGTGFLVLRVYNLGAKGLVVANAASMFLRIWWSWEFVGADLRGRGGELNVWGMVPKVGSLVTGFGVRWVTGSMEGELKGGLGDLVKAGTVVGVCGLSVLFFERNFFYECYKMVRSTPRPNQAAKKEQ